MKHRIRKYDSRNWVLEVFMPSELIPSGAFMGKMSKPKWSIEGYYGRLEHIPYRYLEEKVSGTFYDTKSVIEAIEKAKQEILAEIRSWANDFNA